MTIDEEILSKQTLTHQTGYNNVLWLLKDSVLQCMLKCQDDGQQIFVLRGSYFSVMMLGKDNIKIANNSFFSNYIYKYQNL